MVSEKDAKVMYDYWNALTVPREGEGAVNRPNVKGYLGQSQESENGTVLRAYHNK